MGRYLSDEQIKEYEDLIQFGTERQQQVIKEIIKEGSMIRAAKSLSVTRATIQGTMRHVLKKAALQGWSPDHDMKHVIPQPYIGRGVSTYYNKHGEVAGQWVKSKLDDKQREAMIIEAVAAASMALPRVRPIKPPSTGIAQLLNLFTLTDCHVGMLAWDKEAGEDWDLTIAEQELVDAFAMMMHGAPDAETCIIAQLGDFLHYDGLVPVTPTSGHHLDSDSRFSKMVHTAVRLLRQVVSLALQKHQKVVLVLAEGNHDMASSVWLRVLCKNIYEKEPRVHIVDSELPYYAYQHGKVALFWHHSHLSQFESLPLKFAAEFPKIWGDTEFRVGHTGDKHHKMTKDTNGIEMVQHRTLAARDAYAARNGYRSFRSATSYTYHSELGEVGSNTVYPGMMRINNIKPVVKGMAKKRVRIDVSSRRSGKAVVAPKRGVAKTKSHARSRSK